MTSPTAFPGQPLSERELQVIALLCDGLSTPEIGRRLYIADETVKTHIVRIGVKTGVRGRTAIATASLRMQLAAARERIAELEQLTGLREAS